MFVFVIASTVFPNLVFISAYPLLIAIRQFLDKGFHKRSIGGCTVTLYFYLGSPHSIRYSFVFAQSYECLSLNRLIRSVRFLDRGSTRTLAHTVNLPVLKAYKFQVLMVASLNRTKRTGPLNTGLHGIAPCRPYSVPRREKRLIGDSRHRLSPASMADDNSPQALSAPERYEYTPFENNYSIRILTLEPGNGDEPLVGHLGFENLDLNPQYEAISYCWGADDRSSVIICDGKPLALTKSIDGALRRIRHPTSQRRLWADQVCINQDDIAERSRQVSLMNAIYKGAEHVLVWLGPDQQGVAHNAMTMIHYLNGVFNNEEMHDEFRRVHSEELVKQDRAPWMPLANLTRLPWVSDF